MPATIRDIYRYPVKSMGGHSLARAPLGKHGIPGDRCWAVRDVARGNHKIGKRTGAIMSLSAELSAEPTAECLSPPATIRFPDGAGVSTADPDAAARLGSYLGIDVSLSALEPEENLAHYRRPPPDPDADVEAGLRRVFARTPDEPLPDLQDFPKELLEYESPPGTYFDAFPLLVITAGSLTRLRQSSDANFDVRRFRPNIVLDSDEPEESWIGRTARLGNAVLRFEMACPRCIMTTHGFAELPKDPTIMRTLVQANDGNLGVYATIGKAGEIAVGDALELDPRRRNRER